MESTSCPTNKKPFASREDATQWEEQNRLKYPNNVRQYAYACEECSAYHLSSMPHSSVPSSSHKLASVMSDRVKSPNRKRLTSEQITDMVSMGRNGTPRAKLAEMFGVSSQTVEYHLSKHTNGVSRGLGFPPDLDSIRTQMANLQRQMEELQAKERRLREYKEVKLLPCWEGKGLLIQHESNRLALKLEDAGTLAEKLIDFLGEQKNNTVPVEAGAQPI